MSITGLLEAALYVDDKARAVAFFKDLLGLAVMHEDQRFTAFDAGRGTVLLVFQRGRSTADSHLLGGTIPGHDGSGPTHLAFAIPADSYESWCARLRAAGVRERGEMRWPLGGRSFYFEDPDGHVLELATPGVWPNS